MKNIIMLFYILFFISCKKEDYIEVKKEGEIIQKTEYRKKEIINSKTYVSGKLETEFIFDKERQISKIYQYYPNQKKSSYFYLLKAPNHFFATFYHENEKPASEGEGDYFKDKNLFLRRGNWIFYNKSGEAYSILEFINDSKNEYLMQETIYDTINKKLIKDKKYDSPVLVKK